jgi:hypothetical protein
MCYDPIRIALRIGRCCAIVDVCLALLAVLCCVNCKGGSCKRLAAAGAGVACLPAAVVCIAIGAVVLRIVLLGRFDGWDSYDETFATALQCTCCCMALAFTWPSVGLHCAFTWHGTE